MAARREAQWGAPAGTVVISDEQTEGRGRLHRVWLSPRGSLALSVILRPNLDYLPNIIMLASLAVVFCIVGYNGVFAQVKKGSIKIGVVADKTGGLAAYGYSHEKVIKAAAARINKAGGIAGRHKALVPGGRRLPRHARLVPGRRLPRRLWRGRGHDSAGGVTSFVIARSEATKQSSVSPR